jgi:hypothetical protein
MEGWIKLYRKILEHDVFTDDKGFKVFMYMLLSANSKGELRISRYRTAEALDMNPNTFREVIKRLVRYELITTINTNQFTRVLILNWTKYQVANTKANTIKTPSEHHYYKNKNKKVFKEKEINKEKERGYEEFSQIGKLLKQKGGLTNGNQDKT